MLFLFSLLNVLLLEICFGAIKPTPINYQKLICDSNFLIYKNEVQLWPQEILDRLTRNYDMFV